MNEAEKRNNIGDCPVDAVNRDSIGDLTSSQFDFGSATLTCMLWGQILIGGEWCIPI